MSARSDKQKAASLKLFQEYADAMSIAKPLLLAMGAPELSPRKKPLFLSGLIAALPAPPEELPAPVMRALALRNILAKANHGLLQKLAYRYQGGHLTKEEALQCGALGLLRAIEGFDVTRGFTFSTFADFWIRQSCQRGALKTGHTQDSDYLNHMRASERYYARTGKQASAEDLGISEKVFERMRTKRVFLPLDGGPLPHRQARLPAAPKTCSPYLNAYGERPQLIDTLSDDAPGADEILDTDIRKQRILDALDLLTREECAIIRRIYFRGNTASQARVALKLKVPAFNTLLASAMAKLKEVLTDVLEVE